MDDTTSIECVEPSSFVAAGDRLLVHKSSSKTTACLGNSQTATTSLNVLVEEPERVETDTQNFPEISGFRE